MKRKLGLTASAVFFIFIFNLQAFAIEYGGIGGRPAYPRPELARTESIFIHGLTPGESVKDGLLVINNSAERKTLLIYATDSTPSTGGAFACKQFSEQKIEVGSWIKLDKTEVTLDPKTNEIVDFNITVPKNASVGEHNGCILIQEKKKKQENQSGAVISTRTGLRVVLTVPGEIVRKLEIVNFNILQNKEDYTLQPRVKNIGNVSIDTNVFVTTKYIFGLDYAKAGGEYVILRDQTSEWNFELKKPFWGGWYKSELVVEYDANKEASVGVKSGKELARLTGSPIIFFSLPTPAAAAIEASILLFLIVCIVIFLLSWKRKRWIKKHWMEYTVIAGEDINSIAKKHSVSWKLLAKVNKLKPPYTVEENDKIKVPPTDK
ncbi:MAG: hypothetical protein A2798_03760 [Candidatus Levybacteria bacterium RIFCSPHIGHO2_01_FULL_37_17]|nr:MAG: hypothetical protein A2798_03760 [Candidatus Levybacteria bacterium RIFCSPHIGHO2_01_FULL_37_17]OGH36589.1 MAG: hypothetical protein A2959_03815 [Candidatus Levybacteria bacterium RIFCSPLOWO2_01_FULL_38_23]